MELTVQNMALFIMSFLHVIFVFFYKMKKYKLVIFWENYSKISLSLNCPSTPTCLRMF